MSTELKPIETMTMVPFAQQQVMLSELNDFTKNILKDKQDFGTIPGCGNKPTLFKPGAEKLLKAFGLAADIETKIEHMDSGHREYISKCTLIHIKSCNVVASAEGSCSTMEKKYRYVNKKENPDIADKYNTCLKMASKRALVAAVLIGTGASSIFTQDIEDMPKESLNNKPSSNSNGSGNQSYDNKVCPNCKQKKLGYSLHNQSEYYCWHCKTKIAKSEYDIIMSQKRTDPQEATGEWVDTDQPPEPESPYNG